MSRYPIIWSPLAKITYFNILNYLNENWSLTEVNNFIDRTEEVLGYISQNPSYYIFSDAGNSFKSVIVKQVSLFYRLKGSDVELLLFWDNRQDPAKLAKFL